MAGKGGDPEDSFHDHQQLSGDTSSRRLQSIDVNWTDRRITRSSGSLASPTSTSCRASSPNPSMFAKPMLDHFVVYDLSLWRGPLSSNPLQLDDVFDHWPSSPTVDFVYGTCTLTDAVGIDFLFDLPRFASAGYSPARFNWQQGGVRTSRAATQ